MNFDRLWTNIQDFGLSCKNSPKFQILALSLVALWDMSKDILKFGINTPDFGLTSFLLRQDEPGAINYEKVAPGHDFFKNQESLFQDQKPPQNSRKHLF